MVISVLSQALVGLSQETIVVQVLSLNIAYIILGWVFSMLFRDFKSPELQSIPTLLVAALMEFFNADAEKNVKPGL